jgi:hypothetical protein
MEQSTFEVGDVESVQASSAQNRSQGEVDDNLYTNKSVLPKRSSVELFNDTLSNQEFTRI